jgi:hypothetical protein
MNYLLFVEADKPMMLVIPYFILTREFKNREEAEESITKKSFPFISSFPSPSCLHFYIHDSVYFLMKEKKSPIEDELYTR